MAYQKQTWVNLPDKTTPISADRLNYMEEGIYDNSIEIEQENQKLSEYESILNTLPKVSGEGETVTLDNTANAPMQVDLKGNTSQFTTTGINKLPIIQTQTLNGITITNNRDGSYTLNGTAAAHTYFDFFAGTFNSTADVGYYLKEYNWDAVKDYFGATSSTPITYRISASNRTSLQNLNYASNGQIQIEDNGIDLYLAIRINSGGSLTNVILKPMLVASSSDLNKEVEPYTNGASPNPDYPQDIHVVTGDNTIKVENKNIFNLNDTNYARNSRASISISGNDITVENTNTSQNNYIWYNIPVKVGESIAISYSDLVEISGSGGNNSLRFSFSDTPIETYSDMSGYAGVNKTDKYIVTTTTAKYLILAFRMSNPSKYTISNVQVEYNDTATSYATYQSQSYNVNLGTMELCKIGDYQDYIYKENNKWYKYSAIGKVVLDGSESWSLANSSTNTTRFYKAFSDITNGLTDTMTPILFSNYFTPKTFNYIYNNDEEGIAQYGGNSDSSRKNVYIRINNNLATTVATFKTWLSTHNTTVYYVLATPTAAEITDSTLLSQLETLRTATSYDNQTNISQTNDDLPFIISASALYDLNNLITRLAILETE